MPDTQSTLDARLRLRAAHVMATLRRDRREPAAEVAREVMWDDAESRHVRIKAAGRLTRWSDLCRFKAQALLVDLNAYWGRGATLLGDRGDLLVSLRSRS